MLECMESANIDTIVMHDIVNVNFYYINIGKTCYNTVVSYHCYALLANYLALPLILWLEAF